MIYQSPLAVPASKGVLFTSAAAEISLFTPSSCCSFIICDDPLPFSFSIGALLVLMSKMSGLKMMPDGEGRRRGSGVRSSAM